MKKHFLFPLIFSFGLAITFFSCSKEKNDEVSDFYGRWKTSYGDTITFSRLNRKNILNYEISMNTASPRENHEFTFQDNKLGLKDGLNGPGNFHFFQSFKWIQKGNVFEVQGIHWFLFLSSTLTYFTFTKIP